MNELHRAIKKKIAAAYGDKGYSTMQPDGRVTGPAIGLPVIMTITTNELLNDRNFIYKLVHDAVEKFIQQNATHSIDGLDLYSITKGRQGGLRVLKPKGKK